MNVPLLAKGQIKFSFLLTAEVNAKTCFIAMDVEIVQTVLAVLGWLKDNIVFLISNIPKKNTKRLLKK